MGDNEKSVLLPKMPKSGNTGSSLLHMPKYTLYVLGLLTLNFLANQCHTFGLIATNRSMSQELRYGDRVCAPVNDTLVDEYLVQHDINITADKYCDVAEKCDDTPSESDIRNRTLCQWRYLGTGMEYQLLAGPLYMVVFSISAIPMGLITELGGVRRVLFLSVCVVAWSSLTLATGFATQYWHVAVCRILVGLFSAACIPFSSSLIGDYFPQVTRGVAMGVFFFGLYVGFSLTFALLAAERYMGWRAVYYISAIPGVLLGILIMITVREPVRGAMENNGNKATRQTAPPVERLREALSQFARLELLLLALGGAIRNGAGIILSFNIVIFMTQFHPGTLVEAWMTWLPMVCGSLSSFGGGYLSDRLVTRKGVIGRLMLVITCLLVSAPFAAGMLLAPSGEWAFACLAVALLVGEVWLAVCTAALLDLVPSHLTTTSVAVYLSIINLIGGNMSLLIPPLQTTLGGLWPALMVSYPGCYIGGAVLIGAALGVVVCRGLGKRPGTDVDTEPETGDGVEKPTRTLLDGNNENTTASL